MIVVAILLYSFLSVLGAGIFGGLLAFVLSRPGRLVPTKGLALGVLLFVILYDFIIYAIAAPFDLTLTTGNSFLIEVLGSPDLSDIFEPSFDVFDIGFYALDVFVGTCFGRAVVKWYYKRQNFPTSPSTATE